MPCQGSFDEDVRRVHSVRRYRGRFADAQFRIEHTIPSWNGKQVRHCPRLGFSDGDPIGFRQSGASFVTWVLPHLSISERSSKHNSRSHQLCSWSTIDQKKKVAGSGHTSLQTHVPVDASPYPPPSLWTQGYVSVYP